MAGMEQSGQLGLGYILILMGISAEFGVTIVAPGHAC